MSDAWNDYRLLSAGQGSYVIPGWSVIEFHGSDWREWLQGQVTNDIRKLDVDSPLKVCLCKPTGQLITFGILHDLKGRAHLFLPTSTVPVALERVETMVILEECFASLLPDSVAWNGRGFELASNQPEVSEPAWRLFSLEKKMPNWDYDVQYKTLPPELGASIEREFISYNKGCYTGQEVLQRIHSRGHTNRTWVVERAHTDSIEREGFEQTNQAEHPDGYWLVAGYQRNARNEP